MAKVLRANVKQAPYARNGVIEVNRMLIAITGATGFVGRHLVELHRARGDRVRILKRPSTPLVEHWHDIEVIEGDITSGRGRLTHLVAGVDVLYHCAGEIRDDNRMYVANVEGTRALAASAAGQVKHWVHLSSAAVYGPVNAGTVTEDSPRTPASIYGKSKLEAEELMVSAATHAGYSWTVLRPAAIFGGDAEARPLRQLISLIDKGFFVFVGQPGATLNFVHIENVLSALLACAKHPAAVGNGYIVSDQLTIERVVQVIAEELGRPVPRLRLPLAPVRALASVVGNLQFSPLNRARIDVISNRSVYSINKIGRELDYAPVKSFESGLRELVRAWMLERANAR